MNKGKITIDNTRKMIIKSIDGDLEFLTTFGGNKTGLNYLKFIKEQVEDRINNLEAEQKWLDQLQRRTD